MMKKKLHAIRVFFKKGTHFAYSNSTSVTSVLSVVSF